MLIAINYSDKKFIANRRWCSVTSKLIGKADQVIEYSPEDIPEDFRQKHQDILSYSRGGGLWLWKPYFILETLKTMSENDVLFYCDSGTVIVHDLHTLVDEMQRADEEIMAFEIPFLTQDFTKRETFSLMEMDEKFAAYNQICTGYILYKKTPFTIRFVTEWLNFMYDERIVSYKHFLPEIKEFPGFIAHREDQSVFSLLCQKYGVKPHRDPSNFGSRPWEYAGVQWKLRIPRYDNSNYPRVVLSCRRYPAWKYVLKTYIKDLLYALHIMTVEKYLAKRNIPLTNYIKVNQADGQYPFVENE